MNNLNFANGKTKLPKTDNSMFLHAGIQEGPKIGYSYIDIPTIH